MLLVSFRCYLQGSSFLCFEQITSEVRGPSSRFPLIIEPATTRPFIPSRNGVFRRFTTFPLRRICGFRHGLVLFRISTGLLRCGFRVRDVPEDLNTARKLLAGNDPVGPCVVAEAVQRLKLTGECTLLPKIDQQLPIFIEDLDAALYFVRDPNMSVVIDDDSLGTRKTSWSVPRTAEFADEIT